MWSALALADLPTASVRTIGKTPFPFLCYHQKVDEEAEEEEEEEEEEYHGLTVCKQQVCKNAHGKNT